MVNDKILKYRGSSRENSHSQKYTFPKISYTTEVLVHHTAQYFFLDLVFPWCTFFTDRGLQCLDKILRKPVMNIYIYVSIYIAQFLSFIYGLDKVASQLNGRFGI